MLFHCLLLVLLNELLFLARLPLLLILARSAALSSGCPWAGCRATSRTISHGIFSPHSAWISAPAAWTRGPARPCPGHSVLLKLALEIILDGFFPLALFFHERLPPRCQLPRAPRVCPSAPPQTLPSPAPAPVPLFSPHRSNGAADLYRMKALARISRS